jgi:AcrR family transcriptional regulator
MYHQKETLVAGLRERQKADRENRIIAAAKKLFADSGHENITIEGIAEIAGVSGVTVHNYYGTKSGVLLAMVAESDRELVAKIEASLSGQYDNLIDLTLRFAEIIREHAVTNLDKAIWRQVIAASVTDTDSRFRTSYHGLDHQLALAFIDAIELLQKSGRIAAEVSAYDLGKALFHLQNMRFIQFISSNEMSSTEVDALLRNDLAALFFALPAAQK